jgi:hypothetical protein
VTRGDLAKKTGIPEASIKDIETGTYKMTPEVAMRVSLATGVDPDSLKRGDDPLWDVGGLPFTRVSKRPQTRSRELAASISLLFGAVLAAAEQKDVLRQFHFLFETWLSKTVLELGISKEGFEQVNKIGDRLDPDFSVPEVLLPREHKAKQRWFESRQKLQDELQAEIWKLWLEALEADKEFQSLPLDKRERFKADLQFWIKNPVEYRRARAEQEQLGKELGQRLREKLFRDAKSATDEQKTKFSTAVYGIAELARERQEAFRRQALGRIAARKGWLKPLA